MKPTGIKSMVAYESKAGVLYHGDCLEVLPHLPAGSVDCIFADPPFNLGKDYGKRVNDSLKQAEYVEWCQRWADECIRVLADGGSFFVYNLPKWNIILGAHHFPSKK